MTVSVEEAKLNLEQLLDQLPAGQELVITRDSQPVARLIRAADQRPQAIPGRGRGKLIILADDEDHLADFAEYMK